MFSILITQEACGEYLEMPSSHFPKPFISAFLLALALISLVWVNTIGDDIFVFFGLLLRNEFDVFDVKAQLSVKEHIN